MKLSRTAFALAAALVSTALQGYAAPAWEAAAQLVRQGKPAEAVKLIQTAENEPPSAERAFWLGQAQARLHRLEEAAEAFHRVPPEHPLYPYAARGILYCAWQSPLINFVEVTAPLTICAHAEVAELALAALAEYQLRYTREGDITTFEQLEKLAEKRSELAPIVRLLRLHTFRRDGDYAAGIEYAREMEHDPDVDPLMRHRVRLALAELYYDKEATDSPSADTPVESDEGKGEETLLQFISANPDSPLLEEAFRRLHEHGGASGSEYTRNRLQEWSEEAASHPRRAALALYSLQQLEQPFGLDASALANRAAADLPGEPVTRAILQEHIRKLFEQNKREEAGRYLSLLASLRRDEKSPRSLFLRATYHQDSPEQALSMFRSSAEGADGILLTPALVNALICAMRAGDTESAEQLLNGPCSLRTKRALLLAHAEMILTTDPARAKREIEEALTLLPSPTQTTDAQLDLAQLELATAPDKALQMLLAMEKDERLSWSDAQALHYAALVESAEDAAPSPHHTEDTLHRLYEESESIRQKEGIALRLADRFSAAGQHQKALHLLLDLAQQQPTGEQKAATLLYAGHESAKLGTLAALEHAARLYAECARQGSPLTPQGTIEQAAVLVRINRAAEAFELLSSLQKSHPNLSPAEQAHLLTVQADAYGLERTEQSSAAAIEACAKIEHIANLPSAWLQRARLQHAALCTRVHRHEDALQDYRKVLRSERYTADATDEHSCFFLYYAGAGAVYQLMQLERYDDAAKLADAIAAWPGTPNSPTDTPGPKADAFRRWAQNIRQTHYLPTTVFSDQDSLF